MAQAIHIQGHQDLETFSGPEALMARIQDETLSSRKKLAFEPIQTSTSSTTEFLSYADCVAHVTATNITAGVDDFISQQFSEVISGVENAVRKWDIRSLFSSKPSDFIMQQPSSYQAASISISDLISFIRNHVQLTYSASLANRLENLREASIEEAPEQASISVNSLQSFIYFIMREPRLSEPEIFLTYAGRIRAEWHKSRREHFSVEFLPNGQARYVVFASDPNHASRTDRTTGIVSTETLMAKVNPFNVLSWAAN